MDESVKAGIAAGDEGVIAQVLSDRQTPKETSKETHKAPGAAPAKAKTNSDPQAPKEPKGQPEPEVDEAELSDESTASSEDADPQSDDPKEAETAEGEEPEAEDATPEEPEDKPQTLKVKLDGKEVEIPLDEARLGYMRQADYTAKTMEHAKKVETSVAEMTKSKRIVENTLNEQAILSQQLVQLLTSEDQQTDWNALKQSDPEQWAIRRTEIAERREFLRTLLAKASEQNEGLRTERSKQERTDYEKRAKDESQKLSLAIPEWLDSKKATAEKTALAKYLVNDSGFTGKETGSIIDHRFVVLGRKAMLFDNLMKAKTTAESKRNDGKPAPASRGAAVVSTQSRKVDGLLSQVRSDGGKDEDTFAKLLGERQKRLMR